MNKYLYFFFLTLTTFINIPLSFAQTNDSSFITTDTLLSDKVSDTINLPKLYVSENTIVKLDKNTRVNIIYLKKNKKEVKSSLKKQPKSIVRTPTLDKKNTILEVVEKKPRKETTNEKKKINVDPRQLHIDYNPFEKIKSTLTNSTSYSKKFQLQKIYHSIIMITFNHETYNLYHKQSFLFLSRLYIHELSIRPPPLFS